MERQNCIQKVNEYIAEYYELIDEGGNSEAEKRYRRNLYYRIDGMCQAYAILFGVQVTWGEGGVSICG